MKRVFGWVLLCVLCFGCGRTQGDPNTITVWHWMTDRDKAFHELAKQYQAQTGIKVVLELFAPSDVYSQKITASAQADVLPDIFGVLDTKLTFADFIRYGHVADLTAEFLANGGEWKNVFFEKALKANMFGPDNAYGVPPGIYGVPLDVTTIQMLYNKKLLEKAGYKNPPRTFQDFIDISEALKRVGIGGFVSGWGELWLEGCFASNYAFNIMGEEKVMATYRGEVLYTDPDWIKVLTLFKEMAEKGMLVEGIITKPNKEAEQDFALERAAFAFNGSWSVNVYQDMNPRLDYGVMLPPVVNVDLPMKIWGGAGSSFVVNNHSSRKDKAVAFLKWLTDKEQQEYLAHETKNLPSNRRALAAIPEVLEAFAAGMDFATHPSIWERDEDPLIQQRFAKDIQSIILGKKTPEQVAQEIQQLKAKHKAK